MQSAEKDKEDNGDKDDKKDQEDKEDKEHKDDKEDKEDKDKEDIECWERRTIAEVWGGWPQSEEPHLGEALQSTWWKFRCNALQWMADFQSGLRVLKRCYGPILKHISGIQSDP